MKQAIIVWSFRQNIFPGCYPEKTSKIGRAVDIVCGAFDIIDKIIFVTPVLRVIAHNFSLQHIRRQCSNVDSVPWQTNLSRQVAEMAGLIAN